VPHFPTLAHHDLNSLGALLHTQKINRRTVAAAVAELQTGIIQNELISGKQQWLQQVKGHMAQMTTWGGGFANSNVDRELRKVLRPTINSADTAGPIEQNLWGACRRALSTRCFPRNRPFGKHSPGTTMDTDISMTNYTHSPGGQVEKTHLHLGRQKQARRPHEHPVVPLERVQHEELVEEHQRRGDRIDVPVLGG